MQPSKDDWVPSSNPLNIYCMRNVPNGTESVTDDDGVFFVDVLHLQKANRKAIDRPGLEEGGFLPKWKILEISNSS